jgi:hypothetical protein
MANCSIPNSTPAIGRTSTPLSRRSRKQNSAAGIPRQAIAPWPLGFFNAQRSTLNAQFNQFGVGRWMPARDLSELGVGRSISSGECRVPGGPRGLQNRCRFRIPGTEVGSIPILSAISVALASTQSYRQGCRCHKMEGGEDRCRVSKLED